MTAQPPIRPARPEDGPALAAFIDQAGAGLPRFLWSGLAGPGEDPLAVGARRMAEKADAGGAWVVDEGHGPVAGIGGYRLPDEPEPIPDDMNPILRPLQELENLAPATWYVNWLATDPAHRGRGLGAALLAHAEAEAAREGVTGLSLITGDMALEARRLYERAGFEELARRRVVENGWQSRHREWILMVKGAGTMPEPDDEDED